MPRFCKAPLVLLCSLLAAQEQGRYRNTDGTVQYVGSSVCARCHTTIFRDFKKSNMGRSLGEAGAELKRILPASATVATESRVRSYSVHWVGGDPYQSEHIAGENGKDLYGADHKLAYRVGSGVNGYSFLIARKNWLFEAPLSYYTRTGSWELSPGFAAYDAGFGRSISAACLSCHVGRFAAPPSASGRFAAEPFAELSIGCENCHGPGALHVSERMSGKLPTSVDDSIVNIAKLSPALADNVCLNCHQGNDVRVLQPGKSEADFRPGTWLNDTVTILKIPLRRGGQRQNSDLLEHGYEVSLSKCYRVSQKMSCVTCHSVHSGPTMTEKASFYRRKCLTCHSEESCAVPISRRGQDDCVSCHMPKRAVPTIAHAALTNHRICRTPEEEFPEIAYVPSGVETPGLIHLDRPTDQSHARVSAVALLQAYRELIVQDSTFRGPYLALLSRLLREEPVNPAVLAAAGHEDLQGGTPESMERAVQELRRAIEGGEERTEVRLDLANALAETHQYRESIQLLKATLEREPYSPTLEKAMIDLYMKTGDYGAALSCMKNYLALYPGDVLVRQLFEETKLIEPPSHESH